MRLSRSRLTLAAVLCAGAAPAQQSELTEDSSFLRVTIGGKSVRLEAFVVKRADATGKLPIALIAHGKPTTQGRMLDERASDYARQARDLARRGYSPSSVMRRGFGASDGPAPVPLTCASTIAGRPLRRRRRRSQAALETSASAPTPIRAHDRDRRVGRRRGRRGAVGAQSDRACGASSTCRAACVSQAARRRTRWSRRSRNTARRAGFRSLWVYAKNDSFFSPPLVERMQARFSTAAAT